ncbi:MAG: hypothetical protein ACLVFN_13240 [Enterocloster sp.]
MDTMSTTQILVAIIGSNALFTFVQFLITRHDNAKNALSQHEKAQNDMLIGLGHDKLLYLTDKFVQRGGITLKERRNLDYLYKPYHAAGGNGDCQIGYEACEKLPTLSDEEAAALERKMKRREYGIEE